MMGFDPALLLHCYADPALCGPCLCSRRAILHHARRCAGDGCDRGTYALLLQSCLTGQPDAGVWASKHLLASLEHMLCAFLAW